MANHGEVPPTLVEAISLGNLPVCSLANMFFFQCLGTRVETTTIYDDVIFPSWVPLACCAEAAAKKPVPYHIRIQNFFAKYPGAMKPWKAGDTIPLSKKNI